MWCDVECRWWRREKKMKKLIICWHENVSTAFAQMENIKLIQLSILIWNNSIWNFDENWFLYNAAFVFFFCLLWRKNITSVDEIIKLFVVVQSHKEVSYFVVSVQFCFCFHCRDVIIGVINCRPTADSALNVLYGFFSLLSETRLDHHRTSLLRNQVYVFRPFFLSLSSSVFKRCVNVN